MKFAIYKGKQYKLVKTGKEWELVSKNPKSINNGFIKDNDLYYKPIHNLSELEDILEISIYVEYNTHLPNTPSIWKLEFSKEYFTENSVKLVFGAGLLQKWNVEDKNISSLYVDISEITRAWIVTRSKIYKSARREEINPCTLYEKYNEYLKAIE